MENNSKKYPQKLTLNEVREICLNEKRCSNSYLQLNLGIDYITANEYWEILCRDKELMEIVDSAWEKKNKEVSSN
ncbi:MAG: hypothetical protein A2541_01965 [Candidatus Taylorbacteria bacterium RIFOXYD2_FULL_36_9]|uniref:Uncharacterized protein n=1 Tax=Candidatus Taylorbacteria bacterium RIFOXYD2_FULL_36_9 TaxID=1802338 RepID=A0A1G2PIQ7_9BACT|nr:MAG: hypothetical protein A2541_01965 [Candidatus Taylorbacteria bacterium RIFOXYD2_FULL_36_9]